MQRRRDRVNWRGLVWLPGSEMKATAVERPGQKQLGEARLHRYLSFIGKIPVMRISSRVTWHR